MKMSSNVILALVALCIVSLDGGTSSFSAQADSCPHVTSVVSPNIETNRSERLVSAEEIRNLAVFRRPQRGVDRLPKQNRRAVDASVAADNLLASKLPFESPLGEPEFARARLSLSRAGGNRIDVYVIPTSSSGVCFSATSVEVTGCTTLLFHGVFWEVTQKETTTCTSTSYVVGVAENDVASVAVTSRSQNIPLVLSSNVFLLKFAGRTSEISQLRITSRTGRVSTMTLGS